MPRRSILSAAERESLLALPDSKDDLIRHYTFNDTDLSIIRQRRGPANRLGFAVQLCYLRFPGVILGVDELPFPPLLKLVADQLKVGVESWNEYGQREQTRREHLSELQTVFGFRPFTMSHYRQAVQMLTELAMQTDKGIVLASALIGHLRRQSVILPALNAVERASAGRSPVLTGASTTPWPNHWRTRIAAASTICSSAGTTARRPGWLGCASLRPSQIRGICWNTSNASRHGRHSICLPASSGWFTRTACSRLPARAAR
nr:DUF4158 domain-containing protein [Escherichia coli]